jgi:hypothetical protein
MNEIETKIAVLKLAQAHQAEMLEKGIHSSIMYFEWGDKPGQWEYEVEYLNVGLNGDTQISFDVDSLQK